MCTPALREMKRIDPACEIHFYTDYVSMIKGLPYIDVVEPMNTCPLDAVWMNYEDAIPAGEDDEHLARLIGRSIGINVIDVTPDCMVDDISCQLLTEILAPFPRPYIAVQRRCSKHTPNKDWPDAYWDEAIESMLRIGSVIEIGQEKGTAHEHENYCDLRGYTNLAELIACIRVSDILVAPDSGPAHVAAALKVPAVVILGGYISEVNIAYSRSLVLADRISCSPCWLRTPCPLNRECLHKIEPQTVMNAVCKVLKRPSLANDQKCVPSVVRADKI